MKSTVPALLFSLSIHALFGFSFVAGALREPGSAGEPIQISEVRYEKPEIEAKIPETVRPVKRKPAEKKVQIPAAQARPAKSTARKPLISSDETRRYTISTAQPHAKSPAVSAAGTGGPGPQRPKSAVDFMTDPEKGKIFYDYFGRLKEKIDLNLRRKYHNTEDSLGVVSLYFVLNPDGSLVKAAVIEKESDAQVELQKMALDSLKRSAPFGGFPHDLGNGPLAFNLKVYFDELDRE